MSLYLQFRTKLSELSELSQFLFSFFYFLFFTGSEWLTTAVFGASSTCCLHKKKKSNLKTVSLAIEGAHDDGREVQVELSTFSL